jgi:phosphoglycolate phosphatase
MLSAKPYILLIFDVDGTLTYSDGATGRAFEAAFTILTGVDRGWGAIRPYGMTDPQILKDMLNSENLPIDDFPVIFQRFQEIFLPLMHYELEKTTKARLLPGVRELLESLSQDHSFALALGTGNVEASAKAKLKKHNVDHYFPVGGYSTDAEERSDIIRIAWERSQNHWNTPFQLSNTWVIGDTPKDIAAGKAIGVNTLAVATGFISIQELQDANPTAFLNNFENKQLFLDIVLNQEG